jgi:hypothetical protein
MYQEKSGNPGIKFQLLTAHTDADVKVQILLQGDPVEVTTARL